MTRSTGPGTTRGLRQLCTSTGRVCVVAVDQRQALRSMLRDARSDSSPEALRAFKRDVAHSLCDVVPALLVDPEYGLPAVAADLTLPAGLPLMVAIEESGTVSWQGGQRSLVLPGWDPQAARNAGACAAKLLVYLRADHPATLEEAISLCQTVGNACRRADIPFVLELVPFRLDDEDDAAYRSSFGQHVLSAATIGAELEPDLLKLPWPGPLGQEDGLDPSGLETLATLGVPWVLLSAGAQIETYLARVVRALEEGGACGAIAGRALWQDAVGSADVPAALRHGARERLLRLVDVISDRGQALPLPPTPTSSDWFRSPVVQYGRAQGNP